MELTKVLYIILCALAGYLFGNFQTAVVISRHFLHDDVREHGSGNAGTSNMIRVFGISPGLITFAGDFLKGILAVLAGRLIMGRDGGMIAGIFVAVGHCWPVFLRFKGGKAVATSLAVVFMHFPLAGLIGLAVGLTVFLLWRRFSLMSLTGTAVVLVMTLVLRWTDIRLVILTAFLTALIFLRHWTNIGRLIRGEEKRYER